MPAMGAAVAAASACTEPSTSQEEYRMPWALTQAERFESEDCPFCAMRRSHCTWLQSEIKRLTSEVSSLENTIPPKFFPELEKSLESVTQADSGYTGGVDEVRGTACPKCIECRDEVASLQSEARLLDAQCKARIHFHRSLALRIENLLIEKRRIEAQLFFKNRKPGPDGCSDGQYCSITKVNQPDEDAAVALACVTRGLDEIAAATADAELANATTKGTGEPYVYERV